MKFLLLAVSLTTQCCYADAFVDFNTAGDLTSKFNVLTQGAVLTETAGNGLQNSRGVNLSNADYSQLAIFNQLTIPGSLPNWRVSAYLNLIGTETRHFSLGLVNDPAAYVNGAYNSDFVQPSPDWFSLGISVNRLGDIRIYNNGALLATMNVGLLTDHSNSWFYVEALGSSSGGSFSLSASVSRSDSLGNIGNKIGSSLVVANIPNLTLFNDSSTYFFLVQTVK